MTSFWVAAADLFFGSRCAGCNRSAWQLCESCRALLRAGPVQQVVRAELDIVTLAAGPYRPLVKQLVPRFKDDGALQLAKLLAERLASAAALLAPPPGSLLVPIPSLPAAVRRRGFDHAKTLAAAASRQLGYRWAPLLRRLAIGGDQRTLGRDGRRENLIGSMQGRSTGHPVVLLDDVVTTGASLIEGVRALRAAGVSVIGAAVVAQVG